MGAPKLTSLERAGMLARYLKGERPTDIAAIYGISTNHVSAHARRYLTPLEVVEAGRKRTEISRAKALAQRRAEVESARRLAAHLERAEA